MKKWNAIAIVALLALSVMVLTASRTDRNLTSSYFNADYAVFGDSTDLLYMSSVADGSTTDVANMTVARNWRFRMNTAVPTGVLRIYSNSLASWNGDYTSQAPSNYIEIDLASGQAWESEGLPVYAWRHMTGFQLSVIVRD